MFVPENKLSSVLHPLPALLCVPVSPFCTSWPRGAEPRPGLKEAVGRPDGASGFRLKALLICRPFSSVWPSPAWTHRFGSRYLGDETFQEPKEQCTESNRASCVNKNWHNINRSSLSSSIVITKIVIHFAKNKPRTSAFTF